MGETQSYRIEGEHERNHVHEIQMSPDGRTVYALFIDGAHAFRQSGPYGAQVPVHVELVALDRVTWTELGRVRLATRSGPSDHGLRGRRFALSPDGTRAVVPTSGHAPNDEADTLSGEDRGALHVVNLVTMEEIDTDPEEDGVQPHTGTGPPK